MWQRARNVALGVLLVLAARPAAAQTSADALAARTEDTLYRLAHLFAPPQQSITIPNTFVNGTVADATQVNANFTALSSNALNRNGGTMLGTLNSRAVTPTSDNAYDLGSAVLRFRAFYLTGTSGGVLYNSSTAAVASSGVWGANAFALGGGAGVAPFTESTCTIEQTGHTVSCTAQPRGTVTNTTTQSLTTATDTAVTFDTNIDAIPATIHSTSSNQTRLVVPAGAGGFYAAKASILFAVNATGRRYVYFRKNGTTGVCGIAVIPVNSAAAPTGITHTCDVTLAAADYLEVIAYQDSGGGLNIGSVSGVGVGGAVWASLVKLW